MTLFIVHLCLSNSIIFVAILVRLQITDKSKTNGRKLTELRESAHMLLKQSEASEALGDQVSAARLHEEGQKKEQEVMKNLM